MPKHNREELAPITVEQMDAILAYRDRFEQSNFSAGTWHSSDGIFPYFQYQRIVEEFLEALYQNNWVTGAFDWTSWQKSAQKYLNNSGSIAKINATTIQKLFTTHVRADRFCEGHLASVFENGHIVLLLQRLQEIRDEMPASESRQ